MSPKVPKFLKPPEWVRENSGKIVGVVVLLICAICAAIFIPNVVHDLLEERKEETWTLATESTVRLTCQVKRPSETPAAGRKCTIGGKEGIRKPNGDHIYRFTNGTTVQYDENQAGIANDRYNVTLNGLGMVVDMAKL